MHSLEMMPLEWPLKMGSSRSPRDALACMTGRPFEVCTARVLARSAAQITLGEVCLNRPGMSYPAEGDDFADFMGAAPVRDDSSRFARFAGRCCRPPWALDLDLMQSTLPFSLRFSLSSVSADAKLRISLPRSRHNSALHKDPSLIGYHILPNPSPALDANAAIRHPLSGFSLFGCERTLTNALSRTHTHTACASAYAQNLATATAPTPQRPLSHSLRAPPLTP